MIADFCRVIASMSTLGLESSSSWELAQVPVQVQLSTLSHNSMAHSDEEIAKQSLIADSLKLSFIAMR